MSTYLRDHAEEGLPSITNRTDRILRDIGIKISELERFPLSTNREQTADLQDQLRTYREEVKKKDDLIQKLCGVGNGTASTSTVRTFGLEPLRSSVSQPNLRMEVASLQSKIETLEDRLRHREYDLKHKEEDFSNLKNELENVKEENAKLFSTNQDLRHQLEEAKGMRETFDGLKARNEYAVNSLQEQYRTAQERIAQLEARLRSHLTEKEENHRVIDTWERRFGDFVQRAARLVCVADLNDVDTIMNRIMDLGQENAIQQTKIADLNGTIARLEGDLKDSRNTITRLTSETSNGPPGQPGTGGSTGNIFTRNKDFQLEIDRLTAERDDFHAQVDLLQKRVDAHTKLLDSTKAELNGHVDKNNKVEGEKRQLSYNLQQAEKKYINLLESLSVLLGNAFAPCAAEEGMIKERINKLVDEANKHQEAASKMEQRVRQLQQQFESQYQSGKELELKARLAETEFTDLREKVKRLEQELAARDVLREGVLAERERLAKQMRALADCLKLEYNPFEFDAESAAPRIIAKCEDLLQNGGQKSHNGGHHHCCRSTPPPPPPHHQRIRQVNEQLASTQQELMEAKKKLLSAEENVERLMMEKHTSRHQQRVQSSPPRWMEDRIHELTALLQEAHSEMGRLKEELMAAQDLKMATIEQDQTIHGLGESIAKLEKVRDRQAKKIVELKKEMECTTLMDRSRLEKGSVEMNKLREALDIASRRERQLLEFRSILARLVGIDLRLFATAGAARLEAEVINRVQNLSEQSNQSTPFGPFPSQRLEAFLPQFKEGYESIAMSGGTASGSSNNLVKFLPQPPRKSSASRAEKKPRIKSSQAHVDGAAQSHHRYHSMDPPLKSIMKPRARSTSPHSKDDRKY